MQVLFDQATPVPIRPYLEGHIIRTAFQQGWDKLRNGELLAAAEQAGFDLFLTTDKKHSVSAEPDRTNDYHCLLGQQQWPHVRPHVQRVVDAVNAATPGSFVEINIRYPE
jgi:hypothetical protein